MMSQVMTIVGCAVNGSMNAVSVSGIRIMSDSLIDFQPAMDMNVVEKSFKGKVEAKFPERRITAVITWSDDELDQQTFAFTMDEYRQALVLAANTGPAPAAAQKPLRRGDLVEFCGGIWVVFSEDAYGEYGIATLTGDSNYYYADIDELTRIGSIRKKVKRLKASHCQGRG